jgi:hypothetical protein
MRGSSPRRRARGRQPAARRDAAPAPGGLAPGSAASWTSRAASRRCSQRVGADRDRSGRRRRPRHPVRRARGAHARRAGAWPAGPAAQRRQFVRGARELLIEVGARATCSSTGLHHDSIRGQIAEAIGPMSCSAAITARLGAMGWRAGREPADPTARRYALRHAPAPSRRGRRLGRCPGGSPRIMSFVEATCLESGAHEAEADMVRTAEHCRTSGDDALRGSVRGSGSGASGREIALAACCVPEATARWCGNPAAAVGVVAWTRSINNCRSRPRAPFLRVRTLATRESPALVRDLRRPRRPVPRAR